MIKWRPQTRAKKVVLKEKRKKRKQNTKKQNKEPDSDTEDTEWLYYHGLCAKSHEGWITRQESGKWVVPDETLDCFSYDSLFKKDIQVL